ncbi:MAG: hypothetical protein WC308_00530 [archaeon]|jgi:hypothetical protein
MKKNFNRGFASVLAILAVFTVAIILLNRSYQETSSPDFKGNFSETALFLTTYELSIERAISDCDPIRNTNTCLTDYNDQIIASSAPKNTHCRTFFSDEANNRIRIILDCTTLVEDDKSIVFRNQFRKTFFITR